MVDADITIEETDNNNNIAINIKPYKIVDGIYEYYQYSSEELIRNNEEVIDAPSWVYIYCPNPKLKGMEAPAPMTIVSTTVTVYGIDEDSNTFDWVYENGEYKYYLTIPDINLRDYPYLIGLSDDSLENYKEFYDKHIKIEEQIEFDGSNSILVLTTERKPNE